VVCPLFCELVFNSLALPSDACRSRAVQHSGTGFQQIGVGNRINSVTDQISTSANQPNYIELAADIVSAFVSNNSVPTTDLPNLIASVHSALQNVSNPAPTQETPQYQPAVPVKKSVTPDAIISLIDGKRYRTLKRHLSKNGLTPQEYRQRYGLPSDYPMVAASYTAKRSELAKSLGLGQQRRKTATKKADTSETVVEKAPKKRGRKKAT
jgi:predicted transcriptional regulator